MNISINILILRINQTIVLAKLNSFFKKKNFFFFLQIKVLHLLYFSKKISVRFLLDQIGIFNINNVNNK